MNGTHLGHFFIRQISLNFRDGGRRMAAGLAIGRSPTRHASWVRWFPKGRIELKESGHESLLTVANHGQRPL
jgi:hypothetical protein